MFFIVHFDSAVVGYHGDVGVGRRFFDVYVSVLVVFRFCSCIFMGINQCHVSFVFVDGQFVRIVLQQYAFICYEVCNMAVDGFSFSAVFVVDVSAFFVVVSYSYLFVFPYGSVCQYHGYFSVDRSPFLGIRVNSVDVRTC